MKVLGAVFCVVLRQPPLENATAAQNGRETAPFVDATAESGLDFVHVNGASGDLPLIWHGRGDYCNPAAYDSLCLVTLWSGLPSRSEVTFRRVRRRWIAPAAEPGLRN